MTRMARRSFRESDLYPHIKRLLEGQGYLVKAEIGASDIVAVRGDEPPVIVEMKASFSLALFHQAVERLKLSDAVYVAVPAGTERANYKAFKANVALCRRLGLGLITVRLRDGFTELHLDPAPYKPRQSKDRREKLLKEFHRRVGDPNMGGINKARIMTAYRQDALRCLALLGNRGPLKASLVAGETAVVRARQIMADDHYGWFERVTVGIYGITPKGRKALDEFADQIGALK